MQSNDVMKPATSKQLAANDRRNIDTSELTGKFAGEVNSAELLSVNLQLRQTLLLWSASRIMDLRNQQL